MSDSRAGSKNGSSVHQSGEVVQKETRPDELHDHEHDHDSEEFAGIDLSEALQTARTGLKSDVKKLVDVLPEGQVFIPLSEDLPDTEEGQAVEWEGELTFRPHMILGADQNIFAVAYSDPQLVEHMADALSWDTSGGDLKFICVPAHVAFDLAQLSIEGDHVAGLVFNPGTDQELILQRDEAASLAQGTAIPLVGYVAELPPDPDGESQIVEGADPPPPELVSALERAQESHADVVGVRVATTFNPERDREPHLTIFLTVIGRHDLDRQALANELMEEAGPLLPPPGYADIVFSDAPN